MYLLTILPLLSLLLAIFIHNHMVDPVPGVLLLLHCPRFPFHDSTGFENPCISLVKPYNLGELFFFKVVSFHLDRQGPTQITFGVPRGTFQGSKITEGRH